jgi:hypothetical protein
MQRNEMMKLRYHANKASQSWLENKYRLHVSVVATSVNDTYLPAGLLATRACFSAFTKKLLKLFVVTKKEFIKPKISTN